MASWVVRRKAKMAIHGRGRPTLLSESEEKVVVDRVKYLRQKGAPVDKKILQELGKKAMSVVRALHDDKLPPLSEHWAKSFRKRNSLCRLRRSTTHRGVSTVDQLQAGKRG